MRTPVQPDRQDGKGGRRRGGVRPAPRTSPRTRAAYLVVGAAVLAAGAPGLAGALRSVRTADPEGRARAASALHLHGALLALCAVLAVGVVVYAARGVRAAGGGDAEDRGAEGGTAERRGAEEDGGAEDGGAKVAAELAAVRAELAEARENHVVERDSLLRERAALAERIGGLQASVQDTFVGLSRRTLGLVERQLSFIDELEAHEQEPGTLETLFRLDHLAACMRRHSENLLVLAGADHRGTRRANVPLIDVLRAAVGEIESYRRVVLAPDLPQMHVTGFASGDASHLLAELLENATSCSPPESAVLLTGRLLGTGDLLLVVRDEGIGISPAGRVDDLNARLADADPGPAPREAMGLGLYVVARLAARHGVGVELRPRDRGLDAEVRLPARLLVAGDVGAAGGEAAGATAGGETAGGVAGREPAGGATVAGGAVETADAGEGAGHAVPLPGGAGGGARAGAPAARGAAPDPGTGTGDPGVRLGDAAPVRHGDAAPVRHGDAAPVGHGDAAPVRVGAQCSDPTPGGGAPPPFATARSAATPRTGGWVRAGAGMLPRRKPGGTISGGAVFGGAVAHSAGAGHAWSDHAWSDHSASDDAAFDHAASGHPAAGDPVIGPAALSPVPPAGAAAGVAPAGASPARALPSRRGAATPGGWSVPHAGAAPADGYRTVVAVPAQTERRGVDARQVRRLLGGLQQGSRDGRRAARAEAATREAKEQGAST